MSAYGGLSCVSKTPSNHHLIINISGSPHPNPLARPYGPQLISRTPANSWCCLSLFWLLAGSTNNGYEPPCKSNTRLLISAQMDSSFPARPCQTLIQVPWGLGKDHDQGQTFHTQYGTHCTLSILDPISYTFLEPISGCWATMRAEKAWIQFSNLMWVREVKKPVKKLSQINLARDSIPLLLRFPSQQFLNWNWTIHSVTLFTMCQVLW